MYHRASNAYQQSSATTAYENDKNQILLKLYSGTIQFVNLAKKGIEENRAKIRGEYISKVMTIITELQCALDMDKGGQVAGNLGRLYQYVMDRLSFANLHNNSAALDEVASILIQLKEGFEDAVRQQQLKTAATPPLYREIDKKEAFRCAV